MDLCINNFKELQTSDLEIINGGVGWNDLGFFVVTVAGTIVGAAVGSALFPGGGTVAGMKAGSAIGGIIGGAIFGAGYIAIQ